MDFNGGVLMHRYELGKLLGQGSFAKVYHGRNLETGVSVAIKVLDKEKIMKVGMMDQIKREISVMKLVKHPNVVELYEVMASKTKIYFILEYIKGGELFDKVAKGKLKEDVARSYFQQLILAVNFCHSRGVYHRDLKPENLLLDEEGNLKVSDFGLSALAETKRQDGLLHTSCGTPAYVAPEVIRHKGYDGAKADIWSCGVVLFVLLAGFLPFSGSNVMEMYRKIAKGEFKYPNWFPSDARKLVSKILDPNPKTRISIAKIMENSWFKKGLVSQPFTTKKSENETLCLKKADNLNAFEIISLSPGFDLSGLFDENYEDKKEVRFMSKQAVTYIISKLEVLAKSLNLKLMKNNGGLLKIEGLTEGKNGVLAIEFEIFEIAENVHLIEARQLGGERVEFWEIMNDHIRPALIDV
uniref:CBL-interacting protein kinase 18-like n=1 Tax=Erigeron canadensis TaxID=72917 RepID=UPI001CB89885|nr:CBL-interacting protein kinase 18-like [Erigeron canadensis]XP_043609143.1 CBL-interacting protein kinase 18-like [Erigeron canadensis]